PPPPTPAASMAACARRCKASGEKRIIASPNVTRSITALPARSDASSDAILVQKSHDNRLILAEHIPNSRTPGMDRLVAVRTFGGANDVGCGQNASFGRQRERRPFPLPARQRHVRPLDLSTRQATLDVQVEPDQRERQRDGLRCFVGVLRRERCYDVLMNKRRVAARQLL